MMVTKPDRLDAATVAHPLRCAKAPPIMHPSLRHRVEDVTKMDAECWSRYRLQIERLIGDLLEASE